MWKTYILAAMTLGFYCNTNSFRNLYVSWELWYESASLGWSRKIEHLRMFEKLTWGFILVPKFHVCSSNSQLVTPLSFGRNGAS